MYGGLSDIASKTRDESLRHGKKLPPLNLSFKKAENALSPENTELSTTRTNFTNKDDVEEGQETPMSPGSQSQVSKRTQSSLEMTTTIRQNIRSRAKASLQTKRGSVQLEKRILRSKLALLSTKKKEVAPYDPDEADDKIEKAISIGNQYTMQKQNLEAPVDHQRSFFVDNYEVPLIGDDSVVTSFYQKAYNIIMFSPILKQILTYYKEGTNYGIEDGASIFKSTEKDYTKLIKRSGICFMNNGSELIGSKQETFYTTDVKSYEHVDYEESTLVEYVYRESKSNRKLRERKMNFKTLSLGVKKVKLYHHWLFTPEHIACRLMEETYDLLVLKASQLVVLIKKYLKTISDIESKDSILSEIRLNISEYKALIDELEKRWHNVQEIRITMKVQYTNKILITSFMDEQDLSGFPSELQNFYRQIRGINIKNI